MPPPVPGPRKVATTPQIPGRAYVGTVRSEIADDGEGLRRVGVKPFLMARHRSQTPNSLLSRADGACQRGGTLGLAFVFWWMPVSVGPTEGVVGEEWWRRVAGANWRDIHGPGTS